MGGIAAGGIALALFGTAEIDAVSRKGHTTLNSLVLFWMLLNAGPSAAWRRRPMLYRISVRLFLLSIAVLGVVCIQREPHSHAVAEWTVGLLLMGVVTCLREPPSPRRRR